MSSSTLSAPLCHPRQLPRRRWISRIQSAIWKNTISIISIPQMNAKPYPTCHIVAFPTSLIPFLAASPRHSRQFHSVSNLKGRKEKKFTHQFRNWTRNIIHQSLFFLSVRLFHSYLHRYVSPGSFRDDDEFNGFNVSNLKEYTINEGLRSAIAAQEKEHRTTQLKEESEKAAEDILLLKAIIENSKIANDELHKEAYEFQVKKK